MRSDKPWVVVWAIPKNPIDIPCWIMVKHGVRGWELPGGELLESESNDIAALRELYEETGCLGIAVAEDDSIIEGGVVVLVELDMEPDELGWLQLIAVEREQFTKIVGNISSMDTNSFFW